MAKFTSDLDITSTWSLLAESGDAFELTLLSSGPVVYRYQATQPTANALGHVMKMNDTWIDQAVDQNFWIRTLSGFAKGVLTMDETDSDNLSGDFTNPLHATVAAACVTF